MNALPYNEAIRASTEDLLLNSWTILRILAKSLQLPDNGDKKAVAKLIAIKLIDRHWIPERGTMGDEDGIPERARNCNNPLDLITQEDWSADYLPDTKITFMKKDGSELRILCLDHDTSTQWLNDDSHNFALWIPNSPGRQHIDSDGYGGGPGKTIVTQLTDRTFVINAAVLQNRGDYVAYPVAENARVGNRLGIFGVSMLHGQAPGETVYFLTSTNDPHGELAYFLRSTLADRRDTVELEDITINTMSLPDILTVLHDIFSEHPEITDDYNADGNRVGPTISDIRDEETSGFEMEFTEDEFQAEFADVEYTYADFINIAKLAITSYGNPFLQRETSDFIFFRSNQKYYALYIFDSALWQIFERDSNQLQEIVSTTDGPEAISMFILLNVGYPTPLDEPIGLARKYEPLVRGIGLRSDIVQLEDGFRWTVGAGLYYYDCRYEEGKWYIDYPASAVEMDSATTAISKFITICVNPQSFNRTQ